MEIINKRRTQRRDVEEEAFKSLGQAFQLKGYSL
jgi:hypothetical protein